MGFFLWVLVMLFIARFCVLILCWLGLSACQVSPGPDGRLADPGTRVFNFDWRLSGDPQVGPLQVFDNGVRVWLHFAPEQALPAVFGRQEGQEVLLPLKSSGQFQVIEGLWSELVFRAGRSQAQASLRRAGIEGGGESSLVLPPIPASVSAVASEKDEQGGLVSALPLDVDLQPDPAPTQPSPIQAPASVQEGGTATAELSQATSDKASPQEQGLAKAAREGKQQDQPVFELRLKDRTLRQALIRWAKQAKWVFIPEHWTLEVDFPIKAAARFEGGFENAVAQLLAAAQLNAQPLQACFYSNQVLRVVAWPQACDPGMSVEAQS